MNIVLTNKSNFDLQSINLIAVVHTKPKGVKKRKKREGFQMLFCQIS